MTRRVAEATIYVRHNPRGTQRRIVLYDSRANVLAEYWGPKANMVRASVAKTGVAVREVHSYIRA